MHTDALEDAPVIKNKLEVVNLNDYDNYDCE